MFVVPSDMWNIYLEAVPNNLLTLISANIVPSVWPIKLLTEVLDITSALRVTAAVVELGLIVLVNGTIDAELNQVTAPIYADGYHFDVMSENKIDFGKNEITVNNPKHYFAGYEPKVETDLNTLENEIIS